MAKTGPTDGESKPRRKRGTTTSAFGAGKRESHDATPFYERFEPPEVSDSKDVRRSSPPTPFVCGDARRMSDLEDGSVALVVTSPPYYAGKEYEQDLGQGHVPASYNEYRRLLFEVLSECKRVLEPGGRIAVNVANLGRRPYRSLAADVIGILQEDLHLLLRGEVVWQKGKGASGSCAWGSYRQAGNPVLRDLTERVVIASKWRFDRSLTPKEREARGLPHRSTLTSDEFMAATLDLWEIPPEAATRVGHPAPFPVDLPQRLIELYSYEGDLVLDPFMGSGTTLVAAARTGRRYVGYDLEPEYVETARRRVSAELDRLRAAERLPSPPRGSLEEAERFQAQAAELGKNAKALAESALEQAGFVIVARDKRLRGLGLSVDLVVRDQTGGTWHVDVPGSFTVPGRTGARSGLARNDAVWAALGRAHVLLHQRRWGDPPLLLLTSHLPPRRTEPDRALRAVGQDGFFDALALLRPSDLVVLRRYAERGTAGGPAPDGFWAPK